MGEKQKELKGQCAGPVDMNHILRARRDKLSELQGAGEDPFLITKFDQREHSLEIREQPEAFDTRLIFWYL